MRPLSHIPGDTRVRVFITELAARVEWAFLFSRSSHKITARPRIRGEGTTLGRRSEVRHAASAGTRCTFPIPESPIPSVCVRVCVCVGMYVCMCAICMYGMYGMYDVVCVLYRWVCHAMRCVVVVGGGIGNGCSQRSFLATYQPSKYSETRVSNDRSRSGTLAPRS
ncbi:uncharacterized protein GGS22DRAFT_136946 [Annulohypoxylon maeteangense]|uniref:uncharacterized protein n=1 Tax=Annulohypoxylon maeteangense TaxID=1927788 RepID=UPI002007E2BA|nr:uncharacterized protein GGS22DRAFT_136946 [Annulohypoxylon maeteangense]KAI0884989.1 hypothetical protein GGS22DRAFT_136946 [Annulohypoxylon maeteangense]